MSTPRIKKIAQLIKDETKGRGGDFIKTIYRVTREVDMEVIDVMDKEIDKRSKKKDT